MVDLSILPVNLRYLASSSSIQLADLGPEGFGHYDSDRNVIYISSLGIEKKGFMAVLVHELAHRFCDVQYSENDNRFLREYALEFIPGAYYTIKHRRGKNWCRSVIVEMFAHSLRRYVTDHSPMPKGLARYFSKWFPYEVEYA